MKNPTIYPDLNTILRDLVGGIRALLGENFLSAYLQGSFAVGDWDIHSDVDFVVALARDVTEAEAPGLQAMHTRIFKMESPWAQHLEGSYFPKELLKRDDPAKTPLLYLDNANEKLLRSDHDNSLVVRWVVRERGITLAGPPPADLVDPVSADDLRREVLTVMRDWSDDIFSGTWRMDNRWAQPFAVLSYCRMLHTLETGQVYSKPAGARWARERLDPRWTGLIRRACDERPDPSLKVRQKADPDDLRSTTEFIIYALAASRKYETI